MPYTIKRKTMPSASTSADGFPESDWQTLLANSLTSADQLTAHLSVDRAAIEGVIARYPMRINPYTLALIRRHGGPLQRQAVPCF